MEVFAGAADRIRVIWITQCCTADLEKLDKDVADDLQSEVKRFIDSGIGEYVQDIPVGENESYARMCDAYYGDPSSLALKFFYEHKPVMIINKDV